MLDISTYLNFGHTEKYNLIISSILRSVLAGRKTSHTFMKKVTDVYYGVVGYIRVTRIINKQPCQIFLSIRPARLKYLGE